MKIEFKGTQAKPVEKITFKPVARWHGDGLPAGEVPAVLRSNEQVVPRSIVASRAVTHQMLAEGPIKPGQMVRLAGPLKVAAVESGDQLPMGVATNEAADGDVVQVQVQGGSVGAPVHVSLNVAQEYERNLEEGRKAFQEFGKHIGRLMGSQRR